MKTIEPHRPGTNPVLLGAEHRRPPTESSHSSRHLPHALLPNRSHLQAQKRANSCTSCRRARRRRRSTARRHGGRAPAQNPPLQTPPPPHRPQPGSSCSPPCPTDKQNLTSPPNESGRNLPLRARQIRPRGPHRSGRPSPSAKTRRDAAAPHTAPPGNLDLLYLHRPDEEPGPPPPPTTAGAVAGGEEDPRPCRRGKRERDLPTPFSAFCVAREEGKKETEPTSWPLCSGPWICCYSVGCVDPAFHVPDLVLELAWYDCCDLRFRDPCPCDMWLSIVVGGRVTLPHLLVAPGVYALQ